MRLTLPTRAAIVTTSLALLLVGATGAWQYRGLSEQYVDLIESQQERFAQLAAADIDYKMTSLAEVLARETRAVDPAIFSDPEAGLRFLQQSGLRGRFNALGLISVDGTLTVNDPPGAAAVNVADRPYFKRARDLGEPAISDPLKTRTTGQSAIILAAPAKDAAGRVVGVLAAGLDLTQSNVLGDLARSRVGAEGYYLIETGGARPVYVVHPDSNRVLAAVGPLADDSLMASAPVPTAGWTLRVVLQI
ncbi:MAG: cache domain-containing protein, partial [Gammaproteobacteria bacterium]|nr:cache domain-containing protein [Gammaproteobacteria bacterium]MBU1442073.1 cache domain-containing protein [Gammaproteobacteria bacterium]